MANKKNTVTEKQNCAITLIIPCYNESARLPQMFKGLQEFDKLWQQDYNIILVNDGSTDATAELIEKDVFFNRLQTKNKIQLIHLPKNSGKGFALKAGVEAATGTHVLTLDADMATMPSELINWLKLNNNILPDNEIWIGGRELHNSVIKGRTNRRLLGNIFNTFVRFFTPLHNRDTQCGFKLYPISIAKNLFSQLKTAGWSHDVELLYRANLEKVPIKDMPVTWTTMDGSKIDPIKDSVRMFWQLLVLSLRIKLNYYFLEPLKKNQESNLDRINSGNNPLHRFIFSVIAVLLFFTMPILSRSFGITGDELVQKNYGEKVLSFFLTLGHDRSCLSYINLYYYGGFFDFWCAVANKLFPHVDAYTIRHAINAFFGFLVIFFAGRTAKELGSWRTGWITMLLLIASPSFLGQCMNNPKDIPYAAAYMLSLYFILKLIQQLPAPNKRIILFVILGIALAIDIRIPGIMLVVIMCLFAGAEYILSKDFRGMITTTPKGFSTSIRILIIITVASYFGGLLFYPYGLVAPLTHPFDAFKEMQNLSYNIRILFDGDSIMSDSVPWNYIPQWILITTPIIVLIGLTGVLVLIPLIKKYFKVRYFIYLLAFAVVLPWLYAGVIKQSPLYDGWRHFLFVYPPIVIGAGVFWDSLFELLKNKIVQSVIAIIMVILIFLPVSWSIKNHPNEAVYFNELQGGIDGAYGKYETDYYENGMKQACDWFVKNVDLSKQVIVGTNCANPVSYYLTKYSKNVKVVYVRFDERDKKDWDYGFFYSRFIDPQQLENDRWISKNVIHIVKADNTPLDIIVKRIDKSDLYASQALKKNDIQTAILDYQHSIKADSNNDLAYTGLTISYLQAGKLDSAFAVAQNTLKIFHGYQNAIMITGVIKMQQDNYSQSAQIFSSLIGKDSTNTTAYYYLAKCHLQQGYVNLAMNDLNTDIRINPDDINAYSALGGIYKQRGNNAMANQYFEIVNELKKQMHH